MRGSKSDDSYQDFDPYPAIPVTVDAFQNPRGPEGLKVTTVGRITTLLDFTIVLVGKFVC